MMIRLISRFIPHPHPHTHAHTYPCHQVPAFMWSKSHIPEELWGTSYDNMMHVTDWVPTLASGLGGEVTGRYD